MRAFLPDLCCAANANNLQRHYSNCAEAAAVGVAHLGKKRQPSHMLVWVFMFSKTVPVHIGVCLAVNRKDNHYGSYRANRHTCLKDKTQVTRGFPLGGRVISARNLGVIRAFNVTGSFAHAMSGSFAHSRPEVSTAAKGARALGWERVGEEACCTGQSGRGAGV